MALVAWIHLSVLLILLALCPDTILSLSNDKLPTTTAILTRRTIIAKVHNASVVDTSTSHAASNSQASGVSSASSITFVQSLSTEPFRNIRFTTGPYASNLDRAAQCWSDIMTWRNSSASWYNTHIANRTWPLGSSSSAYTSTWSSSATYYPANISTYKLCDGSPRANVRPSTSRWSGTSTDWVTFPAAVTPTFRPQPCDPDPEMCRLWYYDSNIKAKDEKELLRQCGNPVHIDAPCLIGGGPVQLYYFPVTTSTGNLCANNTNAIISTPPPLPTATQVITTNNHTFTAGSAYLSFNTLYASFDGFWDRLGPTFSDFIFPLASTEISTHCGGWFAAFGHGTQLNYADLNWPVPATAYKCQSRCSATWTSSCATCEWYKTSDEAHCGTIWSDVDPVLAVPTRVRELAPEWRSCRFWDENLPNFWFDPPKSLEPRAEEATPTMPSLGTVTTGPAPSEGIGGLPQETGVTTEFSFDPVDSGTVGVGGTYMSAAPTATAQDPADDNDVAPTDQPYPQPSRDPSTPDAPPESRDPDTATTTEETPAHGDSPTASPDPLEPTAPPNPAPYIAHPPPDSDPSPPKAPALSILASALDPELSLLPSPIASLVSHAASAAESILQSPDPAPGPGSPVPLTRTTDAIIPGLSSLHLAPGETTTVAGVPIEVFSSALLVGSTFVPLPLPAATASTLAFGGLTLTAAPGGPGMVSLAGTTLAVGGAGVAVGEGTTVSLAAPSGGGGGGGGIVVFGSAGTGTMTIARGSGSGLLPEIATASASSSPRPGRTGDGSGGAGVTTVGNGVAAAMCASWAVVIVVAATCMVIQHLM